MIPKRTDRLSVNVFVTVLVWIGVFIGEASSVGAVAVRVGYPQPSGAMLPLWLVSDAKLDQKYGVQVQNIFEGDRGQRLHQGTLRPALDCRPDGRH